MNNIKVEDILKVTGGKLIIGDKNLACESFTRDTRTIKNGDVYIALKGENFDGNIFWKEALEKGACCVIVQDVDFLREDLEKFKNKTVINVKNTLKALQEIASFKRDMYNIPVVAITGSVGKTSTKDIVANVVAQKYKTLKTQGNNNNDIGLPFTILNLRDHEAMIVEMGMNHFGEISLLANIAKPTIGVITNIGTSHIGNLGSRENILKAKLEILEGNLNQKVVINNDNDLLHEWYLQNKNDLEIRTYGIVNNSELNAQNITLQEESSSFECVVQGEKVKINVPVAGEHFVLNSLCAVLVGLELGLTREEIIRGIETFELTKKRMDIDILKNGVKIINDAYNASFESMKASLKNLSKYKTNRKIAVLGDMFELGEYSEKLHKQVGTEVYKNDIDILISSGKNAKYIAEQAKDEGMLEERIFYIQDKNNIVNLIKKIYQDGDVILFKASNGMKFFDFVEELKKSL